MPIESRPATMPIPMKDTITTAIARSPAELDVHRDAYDNLIERCPHAYGLYYQRAWMQCLNPLYLTRRESLYFVLFWRRNTLIGVAPLQLECKPFHHGFVRRLHLYGGIAGPLTNLYGDLLTANAKDSEDCALALRELLYGPARRHWDILDFRYISAQSPLLPSLRQHFPTLHTAPEGMHTFISSLPSSHDRFMRERPKRLAGDIRRDERRLREQHSSVVLTEREALSTTELEELMQVHTSRQKAIERSGRSRDALFDDGEKRRTVLAMLEQARRQGSGWHFLLLVDQKIASFLIGFRHKSTLFIYLIGHSDAFNTYSPTRILINHMYSKAIEDANIDCVHWGLGNSSYKYRWCDQVLENVNLTLHNPMNPLSGVRLTAQALLLKLKAARPRAASSTGMVALLQFLEVAAP